MIRVRNFLTSTILLAQTGWKDAAIVKEKVKEKREFLPYTEAALITQTSGEK
jgi:hypothetical protein